MKAKSLKRETKNPKRKRGPGKITTREGGRPEKERGQKVLSWYGQTMDHEPEGLEPDNKKFLL